MRKPRVTIFDDEVFILGMLRDFFHMRGYEVLSYDDPTMVCPLFGSEEDSCSYDSPCSDVMVTDFNMPGINGVELLELQLKKGCRLGAPNKAVISGYIDERSRNKVREIGCRFFQKPFTLFALSEWLMECEKRMDLSRPLASRRREASYDSYREITFRTPAVQEAMTGIAVNISPSGLCIKAPLPLTREETIRIDAGHFTTCQEASVRWVRKIDHASFLAGLRCC
jgi:DNA-binding NtrC family response regulator